MGMEALLPAENQDTEWQWIVFHTHIPKDKSQQTPHAEMK